MVHRMAPRKLCAGVVVVAVVVVVVHRLVFGYQVCTSKGVSGVESDGW